MNIIDRLLFTVLVVTGSAQDKARREEGASAVEYAVLVAAVAIAVGAAVALFGPQLSAAFADLI
ncbi:MAG: hypothetical protein Q7T56_02875 [Nocardioidaceae bacterium]|nr:hypothetical protein [Nocardioidaceae bacterium]